MDNDVGGAVGSPNGVALPHKQRLLITPPMCQDVTASPRNSPKIVPHNSQNVGVMEYNTKE